MSILAILSPKVMDENSSDDRVLPSLFAARCFCGTAYGRNLVESAFLNLSVDAMHFSRDIRIYCKIV